MKKARRGDVVEVEWTDSRFISFGWDSVKRYRAANRRTRQCFAVGYLVDDGDSIMLAGSISPGNRNVADTTVVPRVAILSQTVLGRASKRVRKALRP